MRYRYRSEDELKDSGVEWLGKIPKDWEVGKFKYSSLLYTGNSIKDNEKDNYTDSENSYPYISTKDINIDYNTINYDNGMYTKVDDKTFKIANKDSILICIEGGSAGRKISYLNQNVSFVNKLCCIQSNKIDSKYQYYYCNSDSFKKEFSLNMSGLIGGVSVSALNNFRLVNPSLFEQEKIANFLDEKTSQFDLIISKKEKLIERLEEAKKSLISEVVTGKVKVVKTDDGYELVKRSSEEMKASGVEWLGEIPNDWDVSKIKYECDINARIGWKALKADEYVEEGYIFLATPNIKGKDIDYKNVNYITKERYDESPEIKLKVDDVLLTKDGSTLGTVNVVRKLEREATVNSSIAVVRPFENLNGIYLNYFIKSNYMQSIIGMFKDGMGVPHLFQSDIKLFNVLLPKIKEQTIISEYLDINIDLIENMKSKAILQIEKLKEAKQSLISEAVTGKIEILD